MRILLKYGFIYFASIGMNCKALNTITSFNCIHIITQCVIIVIVNLYAMTYLTSFQLSGCIGCIRKPVCRFIK